MIDLPPGWTWATLNDVLAPEKRAITDGPFGSKLASRHYTASGARVIRLQNIGDGHFRDEKAFISHEYFEELRQHEVRAGDLLIASLGDELPRACIAPDLGAPAIVKADCIRARIHPHIDKRWVLYALMAPATKEWASSRIKGVGRSRLGLSGIREIPIPIPPLAEQHRIVAALEEKISHLSVAHGHLRKAKSQVPSAVTALNTAAVEGELHNQAPRKHSTLFRDSFTQERREIWHNAFGDKKYKDPSSANLEVRPTIPPGWEVLSLEEATDPTRVIRYGILMPRVKSGGVIPYIEVKDLSGETLEGKEPHRTSIELDAKFSGARLRHGDVVLAVRGSYERSAVVPKNLENANISRDVARISPLSGLRAQYLQIYLQSSFTKGYLRRHARGVAVKGVNIAAIRSLPVVVPPLPIQDMIIEIVHEQNSGITRVSKEIERTTTRGNLLRQALMRTAFEGLLTKQDEADEPASVLLERIRSGSKNVSQGKGTLF